MAYYLRNSSNRPPTIEEDIADNPNLRKKLKHMVTGIKISTALFSIGIAINIITLACEIYTYLKRRKMSD